MRKIKKVIMENFITYKITTYFLGIVCIGVYIPSILVVTGCVCFTGVCGSGLIFPYWFISFGLFMLCCTCLAMFTLLLHLIILRIIQFKMMTSSENFEELNKDHTVV